MIAHDVAEKEPPNRLYLQFLIRQMNSIVGHKIERVKRIVGEPEVDQKTFCQGVSGYKSQMQEITEKIYVAISAYKNDRNTELQVVVAKMGPKHVEKFEAYSPKGSPLSHKESKFQTDFSGFSIAKNKGKMYIIENTKKAAANNGFVKTSDSARSAVCYPVIYDTEVVFVISIMADKKKFFNKKELKPLKFILKEFGSRLILEYYAKKLVERHYAN